MVLTKQEFFDGVRLIRPLLILLVCIAHIPGIKGYKSDFDQYDQIATLVPIFFLDYLARAAVPILTVISGYLAYRSFQNRTYGVFVANKTKRLFLPFLLWNFLAILVYFLVYKVLNYNVSNVASIVDWYTFLRSLIGLDLNLPINVPTYFIRDLFVIMLFVPVINLICFNKYVAGGFIVVYISIMSFVPGIAYFGESFSAHIIFRRDTLVFFVLGYFWAAHEKSIPKPDGYIIFMTAIFLGVIGFLCSMYLSAVTPLGQDFLKVRFFCNALFVLASPVLLAYLIRNEGNLVGKALSFLSPYSFSIFLTHIITAHVFLFFIWHILDWKINETFPLWQQGMYLIIYCVCVSIAAIVLLESWKFFKKNIMAKISYLRVS